MKRKEEEKAVGREGMGRGGMTGKQYGRDVEREDSNVNQSSGRVKFSSGKAKPIFIMH